jgi:general secretion pathway protein J
MRLRPSHFTSRGFTLIELLIAITLLAVLAGMSWRGLDGLVRARDATQNRVNQISRVQTVLAQWQADLDALQAVPGVANAGLSWDGRVLRMVRRASTWQGDGNDPGLWVVAWTRRDATGGNGAVGQWVRWQSPALSDLAQLKQAWAQASGGGENRNDADLSSETLLLPLTQWQLVYFRNNAWTNPLSSADAKSSNDATDNNELPDAIRLQIDLPESTGLNGRLTLDWVRPNFSNSKS